MESLPKVRKPIVEDFTGCHGTEDEYLHKEDLEKGIPDVNCLHQSFKRSGKIEFSNDFDYVSGLL